jgi:tetratricopeptide (TPR) repeat protein
LGDIAKEQSDWEMAMPYYRKAATASAAGNDWRKVSINLNNQASVLDAQGNSSEATSIHLQALELDQQHNPDFVDADIQDLGRMLNQLGEASFLALWQEVAPEGSDDLRTAIWQAAQALTETQSPSPDSSHP